MNEKTLRTALAAAIGGILLAGCEPDLPPGPSGETAAPEDTPGEVLGAPVMPPVMGEPAFTWTIDDAEVPWVPCFEWMPDGCELAVIQAVHEDGRHADVFFKIEPGTSVPEHWHTSPERMVLLSGDMEVDYEGQDPVTLMPGTYAYGPAQLPHEAPCLGEEGDDDCILFIAFEDPVDAFEGAPGEVPHDREAFTWTTDDSEVPWVPCFEWMPEGCELAVIQDVDEDGAHADVFFKVAPDTRVPMHWHTSPERMVLVSGQMRVNYQGQSPMLVDLLTYAYGPAELPHEARCDQGDECILFIAFDEPVDAFDVAGGDLPHRR